MTFLYNIRTIARFERLALRRSWFLRIFIFLGLVVIVLLNLFQLTNIQYSPPWNMVALPAAIPYWNLLLINLGQSVVAVFLAADFLKRDKKLDTAEVVYTKPVSNFGYVFGKAWANIYIFLIIDLILLAVVVVFNIISRQAALDIPAYLEYLLLMVVPSLVFIVGLSFLVMSVVRNQAVTFLIVLGYMALYLFYLKSRFYGLFDFLGRDLPMMKSDIVGFDRPLSLLYHQGVFFLLGLSFLFLSVFLLRRLPRNRGERVVNLFLGVTVLVVALASGYRHVMITRTENALRQRLTALNDARAGGPMATVVTHTIDVEHREKKIFLTSRMLLRNDNDTLLDTLVMSLNPGLRIQNITARGGKVSWRRDLHLLLVKPPQPMTPGDTLTLALRYAGTIDDRICYPDIDTFRLPHKMAANLLIHSSFAFVTPRYVLLTPETVWYPVTGTTYSPLRPEWYRGDFVRFRLHVRKGDGLIPVSQGEPQETDDGVTFVPDKPLRQISLSMGDYVMHSITADSIGRAKDSIRFRVYTVKGHDYFVGSLPELSEDTLKILIRERLNGYEAELNLHYPYSTLSLVEVPIQFCSYQHLWMDGMENVQPGIIYLPEKAATIYSADFAGNWKNYKKWSKWDRQKRTDKEYMANAFQQFLYTFTREFGRLNFSRGAGGQRSLSSMPNPYNIFPEYFDFRIFLSSSRWPVVNRILGSYMKVPVVGTGNAWIRRYAGLSEDERANIALQDKSFHDLLADRSKMQILDNVIKLKGEVLFLALKAHMQEAALLDTFLYKWLDARWFTAVPFDTLATALQQLSDLQLEKFMETWYNTTRLPGYLVSDIKLSKVTGEERVQWLFSATIANPEQGGGVIKMVFNAGRARPSEHVVWLEPRQAKKINYLFDDKPGSVMYNMLISKDIPMVIPAGVPRASAELTHVPFTGERVIPLEDFHYLPEGTLLVDNEDPGFSLTEPGTEGLFYKLLVKSKETGEKYSGFSWWLPINWTLTTDDAFYGKYVRSAWFVRSGKGERKATWKIYVPEAGYYTVYYYLNYRAFGWGRDHNQSSYEFRIRHGDVTDEPALMLRHSEAGWNSLGFYKFPADTAVIELSNKSRYRIVVADAVKLVKE